MVSLIYARYKYMAFVGLLGGLLLLPRLGEQHLWQDEAQSALIAKTILNTGIPHGYDGKNFFSQEDGAEYGNEYVWQWHPWLSFYVLAFTFKCLGPSTFTARLPFALFGIATLLLTFKFVRKRWDSTSLSLMAAAFLGSDVTFILLSRQCRFYSMAAFFSLWALDAYLDMLEDRPFAPYQLLLSLLLLLHTWHFFGATVIVTLFSHWLLFDRKHAIKALGIILLTGIINLPWLLWFNNFSFFSHHSPSSIRTFQIKFMAERALFFVANFAQSALTVPFALVGGLLLCSQTAFWRPKGDKQQRALTLLGLFVIIQLLFAVILAPAPFTRYLASTLAPASIIAALVFATLFQWNKGVAIALLIVAMGSRPVALYAYELTFGAQGTVDWLVDFMETHGKPSDILLTNYEDMPLKFYTSMRIIGGLTGEDLNPARHADWVVLLQHAYESSERAARIPHFVEQHLDSRDYQKIVLPVSDSMLQNREEPSSHAFRTPEGPPYLTLFHRIRE